MKPSLPRSYLYVPGNAADKLAKARGRGPEAILVDLEDAVPLVEKDAARKAVVDWLREQPEHGQVELWVRVNPGERGLDDIRALAGAPALTGVALAKADAATVRQVVAVLAQLGDQTIRLMPMIETPAALLDVSALAAAPRVERLQLGEVDLTGEAGIVPGADEVELLAIRTAVVLASAMAGIAPPLGAVSRITTDAEALRASTERLARLGFVGRACIHPAQLPVVHAVFTPSAAEVDEARTTLRLLAEAEAHGSGVALDAHGRLVDPAVVRGAERVLALHERAVRVGAS